MKKLKIDSEENLVIGSNEYVCYGFGDLRYAVKDNVLTAKQAGKALQFWIEELEEE
jgi:hypothetical protein